MDKREEKKPAGINHSIVEKICHKVYEKSKVQLDRIEGMQQQMNDLTIKVIALETKTDHQACIIQSQQQYIEDNLSAPTQETTQSPIRPKQRSKSTQKHRKHRSSFEVGTKVEGLKELQELKLILGKQEQEWEARKGEMEQEWEEKKREEKEQRESTLSEMGALRQALEEKQHNTGQVEQLRYEMQQKVESQLFNNDNRTNSTIESLRQRMEVNVLFSKARNTRARTNTCTNSANTPRTRWCLWNFKANSSHTVATNTCRVSGRP